jgi:hypothetical protein
MAVYVRTSWTSTRKVLPKQGAMENLASIPSRISGDDDKDFGGLMKVDALCFFSGRHPHAWAELTV